MAIDSGKLVVNASRLLEELDQKTTNLRLVGPTSKRNTLSLGFDPLDRVLGGGLRLHDLAVIAGRPGVGKTIVTLQMARNLALKGVTVVYACYEHHPSDLLGRLLGLEIGSMSPPNDRWHQSEASAKLLAEVVAGRSSLPTASGEPILRAARARIDEYAPRLHFVRATPSGTGVIELENVVRKVAHGPTVLFVDYLQKVRGERSNSTHFEHVSQVTADLKACALESDFSVVAVSALGGAGLMRRRTHLAHLDGAVAVGYDSDIVILLNDKRSIVSPNRLSNTLDQLDGFQRRVVFTVEKNRAGVAPVDLEFVKDFEHFRFDPTGGYVSEQLIEDGENEDFRS